MTLGFYGIGNYAGGGYEYDPAPGTNGEPEPDVGLYASGADTATAGVKKNDFFEQSTIFSNRNIETGLAEALVEATRPNYPNHVGDTSAFDGVPGDTPATPSGPLPAAEPARSTPGGAPPAAAPAAAAGNSSIQDGTVPKAGGSNPR